MHDLCHTDRCQVTITLIGKDSVLWQDAFDPGCHGRCPSVGRFHEVHLEITVGKNRTAHRGYTDGFFSQAHLVEHFRYQAMGNAVSAPGTIVGVDISKGFWALIYNFSCGYHYFSPAMIFSRRGIHSSRGSSIPGPVF